MTGTIASPQRSTDRRAFWAALSGHAIEWYEFGVYGVVAAYVAAEVFPSEDPALSLLLTWTTYSVAFFVRPLGGVVLGQIGDHFGRRRSLFLTVTIMSVATFCLGIVPGYEALGLAAPLAFAGLRLAQGFAVGAEMPSAMSYVAEHTGGPRRALLASRLAAATFSASLAGSLLATGLAATLGPDAMAAWGWRILFLAALPLGLVALVIRRHAPADVPRRVPTMKAPARGPFAEALRTQRVPMLRYLAVALVYCVGLSVTVGGYSSQLLVEGMIAADVVLVTASTYAVLIAAILTFGTLIERIGVRSVLAVGTVGLGVTVVPAFELGAIGAVPPALLGGALLAVPTGILAPPVYVALAEMFPRRVRVTAGAIAFNVATALSSVVPALSLGLRSAGNFTDGAALIMAIAVVASLLVLAAAPRGAFGRDA
jgi:MHS family proline/betaine transporter-like MFS transporter